MTQTHTPLQREGIERFGEMFDGEEGWMLVSCPNGEYVKFEAYASQAAEIARLREASKAAYLGLLVLKTMCRKANLPGGVEATESALKGLVAAMPELPSLSAIRPLPAAALEPRS